MDSIYLYPLAGETSIIEPTLYYVDVMMVKREGVEYDIVSTTPTGRQVQYIPAEAKLVFPVAFGGVVGADTLSNEILFVMYKL